jgi:AraC-like DNA-binding protein
LCGKFSSESHADHAKIASMAPKVSSLPEHLRVKSANTGAAPRIRRMKLQYPELSESQIARQVGCSPANVHRVLARFLGEDSESELAEYQQSKADIYDAIQLRTLKSITSADIAKAPLLARVTGAAILEDKARTIRGQATQINVNVLLDAVQAIKEMRSNRT